MKVIGTNMLALIIFMFLLTSASAKEFLIVDRVISWTENSQGAFYMFMPDMGMPANWLYPDDYYNGMIYTRYEILSVATTIPCGMQFDIFQWKDTRHTICGELCEDVRWLEHGAGSVAVNGSSPSDWWQAFGGVDFSKVADFQSLCPTIWCKDPLSPVAKPGEGGDASGIAWSKRFNWFPITLRVTVVAVSSGSSFSGWGKYIATGTDNIPDQHISIKPNPGSHGMFTIIVPPDRLFKADVISADGKFIRHIVNNGGGDLQLNLQDYPKGIYFIKVVADCHSEVLKILVN